MVSVAIVVCLCVVLIACAVASSARSDARKWKALAQSYEANADADDVCLVSHEGMMSTLLVNGRQIPVERVHISNAYGCRGKEASVTLPAGSFVLIGWDGETLARGANAKSA
jgi:hypothetical protein